MAEIDPVLLRGFERILISCGAILSIFLGYRLFNNGIEGERSTAEVDSSFFKLLINGTGPGLFFMSLGIAVLIIGLLTGGAKTEKGLMGMERN
jgi:hypothetical protein